MTRIDPAVDQSDDDVVALTDLMGAGRVEKAEMPLRIAHRIGVHRSRGDGRYHQPGDGSRHHPAGHSSHRSEPITPPTGFTRLPVPPGGRPPAAGRAPPGGPITPPGARGIRSPAVGPGKRPCVPNSPTGPGGRPRPVGPPGSTMRLGGPPGSSTRPGGNAGPVGGVGMNHGPPPGAGPPGGVGTFGGTGRPGRSGGGTSGFEPPVKIGPPPSDRICAGGRIGGGGSIRWALWKRACSESETTLRAASLSLPRQLSPRSGITDSTGTVSESTRYVVPSMSSFWRHWS